MNLMLTMDEDIHSVMYLLSSSGRSVQSWQVSFCSEQQSQDQRRHRRPGEDPEP